MPGQLYKILPYAEDGVQMMLGRGRRAEEGSQAKAGRSWAGTHADRQETSVYNRAERAIKSYINYKIINASFRTYGHIPAITIAGP